MNARIALAPTLFSLVALASANPLTLTSTRTLDAALSVAPGNFFHPQGLGYDDLNGELLFAQVGANAVVRTDTAGNVRGSVFLGSGGDTPGRFTVAAAANASGYFVSDYWANAMGNDLLWTNRAGGDLTAVGSERSALVGTPMDVRGNTLFRTEPTTGRFSNDALFGNLRTVRVSSLSAPDDVARTLELDTPTGIGDLTVDLAGGSIFVLGYGNGNVYRYGLVTGELLDTYELGLPSATAGIAYGDGYLYHYAWQEGSGSVLTKFRYGAAVPEPTAFAALALGAAGLLRRRRNAR